MRRIDFSLVLREAVEQTGIPAGELPVEDFRTIRNAVSSELCSGWEAGRWPELCLIERRYFRDVYASGTTYGSAGVNEVYYPATRKYYVALRTTGFSGQAPATLVSGLYVLNSAYWAESATAYAGNDWVTGTAYVVGDIRFYVPTAKFYQCYQAHTSSGVLTPDATGGNERWGVLVEFDRYVAYEQTAQTAIGEALGCWDRNPRIFKNAMRRSYELSEQGVQVLDNVTEVWVEFRKRCPTLTGDAWDALTIYGSGDQVYYEASADNRVGNFYDCVSTTVAGESPVTAAAKWTLVELPWFLRRFLAWSGAAGWLQMDGQSDKGVTASARALGFLEREAGNLFRQQRQIRRIEVLTR